jgi:Uma2 family endonuclease
MNAIPEPGFSGNDYLAWEVWQSGKHEYLAGEIFGMAGAGDAHVTISLNVASHLKTLTRGTPCRTYIADMKLRVEEADAFFYPDVFVTCDPRDHSTVNWKAHARLVVEVLSDSTAGYDRGRKFQNYRLLDSLQEYGLIDPEARTVDVFRRAEHGNWVLHPYQGADTAEFQSLECRVPLDLIFEDVPASQIEHHSEDARPAERVPPIHT